MSARLLSLARWATILLGLFMAPQALVAAEKITYYHFDATGSPVAATDEEGKVIWRERYEPYGDRIDQPPAAQANTRWHTGHVQDPDTGLVYAGARYYDPTLGRFLAIDPTGPNPNNLHSINRYAYGNNGPYRYVDPDGQVPVDTFIDAGYVIYDFGRFLGAGAAYTVGTVTGNEFLRAEGAAGLRDTGIDLGGSATGFVVPYAPAAVTRGVGRGVGDVAKEAKGLGGNPFKDKTPEQIDKMFRDKGFEPRGPDPIGGKGGYVNPETGRSYHIDPGGTYKKGVEPPHVDVNRSRGSDLPKKKFPIGD
jgi:RHS repeat-associated protein